MKTAPCARGNILSQMIAPCARGNIFRQMITPCARGDIINLIQPFTNLCILLSYLEHKGPGIAQRHICLVHLYYNRYSYCHRLKGMGKHELNIGLLTCLTGIGSLISRLRKLKIYAIVYISKGIHMCFTRITYCTYLPTYMNNYVFVHV